LPAKTYELTQLSRRRSSCMKFNRESRVPVACWPAPPNLDPVGMRVSTAQVLGKEARDEREATHAGVYRFTGSETEGRSEIETFLGQGLRGNQRTPVPPQTPPLSFLPSFLPSFLLSPLGVAEGVGSFAEGPAPADSERSRIGIHRAGVCRDAGPDGRGPYAEPAAYADGQRGDRAVPSDGRREDRRARVGGRPPGEGRCGGDPGGVQSPAVPLVVVVLAAGGLLSWKFGGVTGRASPEVTSGQRTAKAGELETATAPDPLAQARNRLLRKTPRCLTLSETNHCPVFEPCPKCSVARRPQVGSMSHRRTTGRTQ